MVKMGTRWETPANAGISNLVQVMAVRGTPTRTGTQQEKIRTELGGEWNAMSGHITIRDNRAHSWTEAYLGAMGWVRVDSTPVAAQTPRAQAQRI
jgi:transglutaminase-like putative cysteine protease